MDNSVAQNELLRRREAQCSLIRFTQYTYPQYIAEPYHYLIGDTLDKVVSGEIKRLMIFAPPDLGMSELVSVCLPAFWLGARPGAPVILSSCTTDLTIDKGYQAREVVESEAFSRLFPDVVTLPEKGRRQRWRLQNQHSYVVMAGVGSPIAGFGGMLGIIDSPFESWEQAQSELYRNRVWDWYRTTFRTHIFTGGAIIMVMSRMHEDDLAGRLLVEQSNKWHVLRLPAMVETQKDRDANNEYLGLPVGEPDPLGREAGDPLCPIRFSRGELANIKADVGQAVWATQYQGVPANGR